MGILYRNNNDYVNKIDLTPFFHKVVLIVQRTNEGVNALPRKVLPCGLLPENDIHKYS